MNLERTEEQNLLTDTFSRLFRSESTSERIRAAEPSGYDKNLWQQLVEMGAPGIRAAEAHGGSGMSLREIALICEQAGHYAAPAPVVECSVAAKLLSDIGCELALEWLNGILDGSVIVSIALQPVAYAAKQVVSGGAVADAVIALDGTSLVLVAADADKPVGVENLGSLPIATWDLRADDRLLLAEGQAAANAWTAAREEWKLLAAAQMSGICNRALAYASEYCSEREAFGVKIGTFQGLSHPLAECASAVEGINVLLQYTLWKLERKHDDAAAFPAMVYWWATEATSQTIPWCIQVFGGLGVSSEHDIQLFARRGMALTSILGDRQEEAAAIAGRYWGEEQCALPEAGETTIDFELGAAAQARGQQAQEAFDKLLTEKYDDYRKHSWDGFHPDLYRALAKEKLLFPQWPEEYGGLNASVEEVAAIDDAFFRNRVTTYPQGGTRVCGEVLLKFGSDKIKKEALPGIISGEGVIAIGLTEPGGGSDVFAAKTRAVKKGDKWIINGQKMYTTGAHRAKYVLLLTNTDPSLPKHVGKTMFLVPMDTPGVEVHPVETISGDVTNMTFYTDVELSDEYRIGAVNDAARTLGYMLSVEQGGGSMAQELEAAMEQTVAWAKSTERNGQPVFDNPLVQARLGATLAYFYVSEALKLRATHDDIKGIKSGHYGSICKAFSSEAWKKCSADLLNIVGPDALYSSKLGLGEIEAGWRASLASTVYAGTTQVHLSKIAEQALGLPRSRNR